MLPQRQREFTTGNNFTFSNSINKGNNSPNHSDEMEYNTWAERIKGQNNSFGKQADAKLGAWTRRVPKNYNPDEDEFSELQNKAGPSVNRSRISHISHSARAQTIAMYRQEMLNMVRGMPEMAYELSLRDMVEPPKIMAPKLEEDKDEKTEKNEEEEEKKEEKTVSRSESMERRRLSLKKFIPRIPSVLKGRKSISAKNGTCSKVSPKPVLGDGSVSDKSTDREWWNEEFEHMASSRGSSSSANSSTEKTRRIPRGCYSFFRTR